jgi:peptide/nickel transport system ATP-binding protein
VNANRDPSATKVEPRVLVEARDLVMRFDVSAPWVQRVIEGRPRQFVRAVDEVSFAIARGRTLALVGESGCGKSTVARLLVGLLRPTSGEVVFPGVAPNAARSEGTPDLRADVRRSAWSDLVVTPERLAKARLQMVFQDPQASLNPRWTVGEIVAEPIVEQRVITDRSELAARVADLLVSVGLSATDAGKLPHQFSGGQRQRISIARALATDPEFLICDEPTSALDVAVQAQVLNLIRELQLRRGLTCLFISHNLAVVRHMGDEIGVMVLGRIVELAERAALFARPMHPYTRMLFNAVPDLSMSGRIRTPSAGDPPDPMHPPAGCSFHPRCPQANDRCRVERPELQPVDGRHVACHAVAEGRI